MNQSLVLTFEEWIKMIRSQATSISQQAKDIRIHKEKLSSLFAELKLFNQKTSAKKFSTTPPNATETNALRSVMNLLTTLKNFVESCKESKMIQTIANQETEYPISFLTNFRTEFNNFIISNKILTEIIFTCDESLLNRDNFNDSKVIIDIINRHLEGGKISEFSDLLEQRREEYQEIVNNLQEENIEEDDKQRIVSETEYNKKIQVISDCFVKRTDFQKNSKLGQGNFGIVYSGIQKSTSKVVAIKELKLKTFNVSDLKNLIYEVGTMSKIRHYGVLPLIGYIPDYPYSIITEFMSGGTLNDRIFNTEMKPLDGTKLTIIALGVAYTMKHMHNNNYYHRDLKPDNIILDADDYPYIIDFGFSRLAPEDSSILCTTGIGSPAFMAPELFDEVPYDFKIDVYSYAITLWVMLTGQKPWANIKGIPQLMMQVTRGSRPKLPVDAGPLGTLIEKCWSNDPKDRPSFDSIVSILETGEVFFPGTNKAQVNSYINIYKKKTGEIKEPQKIVEQAKVEEVDLQKTLTSLAKIQVSEDLIDEMASNIQNADYVRTLTKNRNFVRTLLSACDWCETSDIARKLVYIFTGILVFQKKLSEALISKVLGLFIKFGSTEMTEILDFIDSFPLNELAKIKLNGNHLNKFASFLKHSNVSLRTTSTNVLIKIIENEAYSKVELLVSNLREVISNLSASITSMPDLLFASLKAVNLLLPFKELQDTFISYNLFDSTVSVFASCRLSREEIYEEASNTLKMAIKEFRGNLVEKDIMGALLSLKTAANNVCEKQLVNYISAMVSLLELNVLYNTIEKENNEVISNCFETFLLNSKSDESIVLLLKFCYSLLIDEKTHNSLASIASSCYLGLIIKTAAGRANQTQKHIQSIASCCLIQSMNDENIETLVTEELKSFIKKSLKSLNVNDDSTINALRICSALSCRRKGAEFLMDGNFTQLIDYYLGCGDKILFKLAVMTYSSISAVYPGSEKMISNVPKYLNMLNDKNYEDLLPYISSFLANATISSEAAVECANNLSIISKSLNNLCVASPVMKVDPKGQNSKKNTFYVIYKLIKTLLNIVMCNKALKCINNSEYFTTVYKAAKQPFCNELFFCFLELFSRISRTKFGVEAFKNSKLGDFLQSKIQCLQPDDSRRALILRILAVNA